MKKLIYLFLIIFFISTNAYSDEALVEIKQQLDRINRDISDLQKQIYTDKNPSENKADLISTSELSVFDMRLRDIENELKNINLNYENLFFEIEELRKYIEEVELNTNTAQINNNDNLLKEENSDEDIDSSSEENTLGTLKINSEDLSDQQIDNEQNSADEKLDNLSPEEKFQIAFDLLRSQKFEDAKLALTNFINNYPTNDLTGSAHYWLGEIFLLKKEYREAALILAEGYQKYPESIKSPDSLYKLSDALFKIDKKSEGCDTLKQFILKYPNHKLNNKVNIKITENNCE